MRATEYLSDAGHKIAEDPTMEDGLAAIPPNVLIGAALASIGISLTFKVLGQHRHSEFVGHWAPTFIGLAILQKMIARDK